MAGRVISDAEMEGGSSGGATLSDQQMEDAALGLAPRQEGGPGVGEALLRGGSQGALLNHRDEIVGALESLLDKVRGKPGDISENYAKHRDESRAADTAAQAAHPVAYGAGSLAGGLVPLAIPGVGEGGILAQAGQLGALGAVAGAGNAKTLEEIPAEAGKEALGGALAGAGGALAGRALGAIGRRAAPGMQVVADDATLRAVGQTGATLKGTTDVARHDMAEMSRAFLSPLDTVGHVSEKLTAARLASNDAIGDALGKLDEVAAAAGYHPTTGLEVAGKLRGVLDEAAANPGYSAAARNGLAEIVGNLEQRGPMSMRDLDALRRTVQRRVSYTREQMAPGNNEIMAKGAKAIRQHLDDIAGQIHPDLAAELGENYGMSAAITPLAQQAVKQTGSLGGQQAFGLSGRVGLVAGATALAAGSPITGLALIAAGFARKGLEQRGNALAGVVLNKLAQAAKDPAKMAALGKMGGYVASAAQRGPAALAAAHYTASQMDPQYAAGARAVMNEQPQTSGESGRDDVLDHAPSLKTSIPIREP